MSIYGAQTDHDHLFVREAQHYDAVLVLSFGGPEGMDDVVPFLENVTRGRNVPRERLLEVVHHYERFGGVSPINRQNRALIASLENELLSVGIEMPVYFGNRNWHPFVTGTVRQMRDDGIRRGLVFVTSGFSCYSGCRQYREDVMRARKEVGPDAPVLDKIRVFYNHPGFIEANVQHLRAALDRISVKRRTGAHVAFTAHSLPLTMARASDYEAQLRDSAKLVTDSAGVAGFDVVYQSRSGPPSVPWLEPDILDHMESLASAGVTDLIVLPLGFISDHMEVLFDLDAEAVEKGAALGMTVIRAASVGTASPFVQMIRELIEERITDNPTRRSMGTRGPSHDVCPVDCCLEVSGRR